MDNKSDKDGGDSAAELPSADVETAAKSPAAVTFSDSTKGEDAGHNAKSPAGPAPSSAGRKRHTRNVSSSSVKSIIQSITGVGSEPEAPTNPLVPTELAKDDKGKPLERVIFSNDQSRNDAFGYCDNYISTAKYTALTFLPLNLFEQFQRVANIYFLCLIILQLIPQISALNPVTTAFPLVVVLSITAIKDAVDDYKRHQSDKMVNTREIEVLRDGVWTEVNWRDVRTGDIVRVEDDDPIPADIVVLNTSLPDGACYVETAELDGETNLKLRQAKTITVNMLTDDEKLSEFQAFVQCEPPNTELHAFNGKLVLLPNGESVPLDNDNLLLRGMTLRNSPWVVGLAVFTGHDTKLMMNSSGARFKRTKIDLKLNRYILFIFALLLLLCFISGLMAGLWANDPGIPFEEYLPPDETLTSPAVIGVTSFFTFMILYSTLVPISLYISVEMIRLGLSMLIDWDLRMYHPETNTPARARTTTLNEELGQINYIFSDKTGTLTQNVMRFLKCSIAGQMYGKGKTEAAKAAALREPKKLTRSISVYREVDFSANPHHDPDFKFYDEALLRDSQARVPDVDKFMTLLAVCHTVQCDVKDGKLKYAAQSPDEAALVSAAKNFGYVFKGRTQDKLTIEVHGETQEYEILNTIEFNSDRKRMSIIVRDPEGKLLLLCKGADNVMLSWRAVKDEALEATLNNHLELFSTEGLRTLVLAERYLDEDEYRAWDQKFKAALMELDDRQEKIAAVAEEIECNMRILGGTAIEDKLQEGVPQTIANLRKAAIKIWVLTGDKQETAINIGYACQLLNNDQRIFIVNERSMQDVKDNLTAIVQEMSLDDDRDYALVIDGAALSFALDAEVRDMLLEVGEKCSSVVCCRVSPIQKALVVRLVKDNRPAITLAIGDGANDVSMIQNAHIGIGISGLEGRQAVLASDYSIAQFRFLERLLLVHGRWAYVRMCRFLQYFFYKNFVFTLCQFWFAIFSCWSGQTIYDQWFVTFYNVIFTSLPVIAAGMMEQDVNDRVSMIYPHLYEAGQRDVFFNKRGFFLSLLRGTYQSVCCFFIPYAAAGDLVMANGTSGGFQWLSVMVSGCVVMVVNLQMAIDLYRWTIINHVFIWSSIASWFVFTWFLYGIPSAALINMVGYFGVVQNMMNTAVFWFTMILAVTAALLPTYIISFARIYLAPYPTDIVREICLLSRKARQGQAIVEHKIRKFRKHTNPQAAGARPRTTFNPVVSVAEHRPESATTMSDVENDGNKLHGESKDELKKEAAMDSHETQPEAIISIDTQQTLNAVSLDYTPREEEHPPQAEDGLELAPLGKDR